MRKRQSKEGSAEGCNASSVRFLRLCRWPQPQYGLQLIASLAFGEEVSQFVILGRLEENPLKFERTLQKNALPMMLAVQKNHQFTFFSTAMFLSS